jgi:predicted phosphodiesterase
MRIGLLSDIHEDTGHLTQALGLLRREGVDRLVTLGDLFDNGQRVAETAGLLAAAGVVGVWGNHDLGLCHDPAPRFLARYPASVFDYLWTLRARVELDGCLFSHGLPHWDAYDPAAYYLEGRPEAEAARAGIFAASGCRVTFVGHFHRWLAVTPEGALPWDGDAAIRLDPARRYLVVIAAVCDGWCAVYDTEACLLEPRRLDGGQGGP